MNYRVLFSPHENLSIIKHNFQIFWQQTVDILLPDFHYASQRLLKKYYGIVGIIRDKKAGKEWWNLVANVGPTPKAVAKCQTNT